MKFLGIDYGTKRVGIAISDLNGRLAFPGETLKNNGELFRKLIEIVQKEKVAEIVVGESLDFFGLPNLLQKEIDFFIDKLKKKFAMPVHKEKEFLTSVEARRYSDHNEVDASAAALILQRYLEKKNKYSNIL